MTPPLPPAPASPLPLQETNGALKHLEPAPLPLVDNGATGVPTGVDRLQLNLLHASTDLPVAPPVRRRWWPVFLISAAICTAGLLAWQWWPAGSSLSREITAVATKQTLDIFVQERGDLESANSVEVRCEVEGRQIKVVEVLPEGTRVTKDQVVIRFDVDELTTQFADQQIKWKQAEGKAKAAKEELAVQKNKSESEIAQAQLKLDLAVLDRDKYLLGEYQVEVDERLGAIALAKRDLQEAEEKLEHYRSFVKKGFGTPEQLRLKEAEVARYRYYLSRDEAKLKVLQDYTLKRQEAELTAKAEDAKRDLARVQSSTAAAMAKAESEYEAAVVTADLEKKRLERLQRQLDKAIVKAPIDGILVYSNYRYWDESSRMQPGAVVHYQQPLFTLPDLANMRVKMKIHESVVKKVKAGQKAEVVLEALPNLKLNGTILSVATLAESNSPWMERGVKEFSTMVAIDQLPPEAGIKPGMTAEVKIHVQSLPQALVVPVLAVIDHQGKSYVFVQNGNDVQKREVVLGESNNTFVAIKTGLAEGDRVVLDARARLLREIRDGERVAVSMPRTEPPPK